MHLRLIAVGRARGPLAEAAEDYARRAANYWKLAIEEVKEGAGGETDAGRVKSAEAERIRRRIPPGASTVALTRAGRRFSSAALSAWLEEQRFHGRTVCFLVGGAHGLHDELVGEARLRLSLSDLTLPHDLARLTLLEQLYRAGTILRGEPYHKGKA